MKTMGNAIHIYHPYDKTTRIAAALFDFDGTLSLIRSGWMDVMVTMMVDLLSECGTEETREMLTEHVTQYVTRLTGKQTIYQMIQLADEIQSRGTEPKDPLEYKHQYHDLLLDQIGYRIKGLESGKFAPDQFLVPGSLEFLTQFVQNNIPCYLASGTDEKYVKHETNLLGLNDFFPERIYGAKDAYKTFSKAMIIQQIIETLHLNQGGLLVIGDGYVEIENGMSANGYTIGVATQEPECLYFDPWKYNRLLDAGACMLIPHFKEANQVLATIL